MDGYAKKIIRFIFKLAFRVGVVIAFLHGVNKSIAAMAQAREAKRPPEDKDVFYYKTQYGSLRYKKTGNGPPLLLVHGVHNPLGMAEWRKNIKTFSCRYTVYAVDLIGYGRSSKPKLSYSSYLHASVINAFLKNVVGEAAYVAASGGSGAICLAAARLAPELYKKILMISPTGAGTLNLPASRTIKCILEAPVIGLFFYNIINSKPVTDYLLKTVFFRRNRVTAALLDDYYDTAHYKAEGARFSYASAMSSYTGLDLINFAKKAAVPVLYLWGDDDILNPLENSYYVAGDADSVRVLEGARQFVHYEEPWEFYQIARDFFK